MSVDDVEKKVEADVVTPEQAKSWNEEMAKEEKEEKEKDQHGPYAGHEVELLEKMKEAVKAAGIPIEGESDSTFMRFLRARGMNVAKGSKLYMEDVKWRKEYFPIKPEPLEVEMKAGKSYLVDLEGQRPWVFMFAKHHDTTKRDMDTFRRFAVYVLEKVVESMPPGEEKFDAVLDLGEAQYKNLDGRGIVGIFDTLQAHYPERLHRLYVIHVPYIFWGVWKMIKPLIDPRTKQKIRFIEDSELNKVLTEDIPAPMLPKCYGGSYELQGYWERFSTPQSE